MSRTVTGYGAEGDEVSLVIDDQPSLPDVILYGERVFVMQPSGMYIEAFPAIAQNVALPVNAYLGGIKNQDGTW